MKQVIINNTVYTFDDNTSSDKIEMWFAMNLNNMGFNDPISIQVSCYEKSIVFFGDSDYLETWFIEVKPIDVENYLNF